MPTVKPYAYLVSFSIARNITYMKSKIDGSKDNIRKVKVIVLAAFY